MIIHFCWKNENEKCPRIYARMNMVLNNGMSYLAKKKREMY